MDTAGLGRKRWRANIVLKEVIRLSPCSGNERRKGSDHLEGSSLGIFPGFYFLINF